MDNLLRLSRLIDQITGLIGKLAAWLMIVLMLVIVSDVALRHFFVIGSTKLQELEWHLHGALFLLSIAWAYNSNTHVRIELFSERWSADKRAWVELLGCSLFLLPYTAIAIWFGWDYVEYSLTYNEASSSPTGLSNRWIIKATIPLGFLLLGMSGLSKLIKSVVLLFGPVSLRPDCGFENVAKDKTSKFIEEHGGNNV